MTKFSEYPAVKILTVTLAGIFLWFILPDGGELFFFLIISGAALSALLFFLKKYAWAYLPASLAVGLWIAAQAGSAINTIPDKFVAETPAIVEGEVVKILSKKPSFIRCIVDGRIDARYLPMIENTKTILSIFRIDERTLNIVPGARITASCIMRPPRRASLPTDFTEARYCASLGVSRLARTSAREVALLAAPEGWRRYRETAVNEISKRLHILFPPESEGIVSALLTGDKSKISRAQRERFSLAGTAHLLAVSGLHTGIIAAALYVAFGFIANQRLRLFMFCVFLLAFVVLTGMQPSAMRAAAAGAMQRRLKPLNILCFALLLLIIAFPEMIFSVGFQMSGGAMLGITLVFVPARNFFTRIIPSKNRAAAYLVNSVSLTLSASIVVAPLAAYYFEVFSLVSPFANIFVVALMSLALIFSLCALLLSFVSFGLASIYAAAADSLIGFSDTINALALHLPFAYIKGGGCVYASALASLASLYVLTSSSIRQTVFRLVSSAAAAAIIFCSVQVRDKYAAPTIVPRDQYTASFIPLSAGKTFVLISDRKPRQYPFRDFSMEEYLIAYPDSLIIGITGNAGQNVFDLVGANREAELIEIPHGAQETIRKALGGDTKAPQVIEFTTY